MVVETIKGKIVQLRTADETDAEFTLNIRKADVNTKYMPKVSVSLDQQYNWIRSQREAKDSVFFVVERLNGEKIGTFSLYNIEIDKAESGRMIIRGNQIETVETVLLFHDFAFFQQQLKSVYSEIDENNKPAIGIAKSVAAKNMGKVDEKDPSNHLVLYTLLKKDYENAREKLIRIVDRFAYRV